LAAPIGNTNAAKAKIVEQALRKAAVQDNAFRLKKGCEKLMDAFADGEPWALQLVFDRLDGKPAQAITTVGEDGIDRPVQLIVYSPIQLQSKTVPATDTDSPRLGYQESGSGMAQAGG